MRSIKISLKNGLASFRPSDSTLGYAAVLSLLASIAAYAAFTFLPPPHQTYSDIVAGPITWSDYAKQGDYVLLLLLGVVSFASFLLAAWLLPSHSKQKNFSEAWKRILYAMACCWIGIFVFEERMEAETIVWMALSAGLAFWLYLRRTNKKLTENLFICAVEEAFTAGMAAISLASALRCVFPQALTVLPMENVAWGLAAFAFFNRMSDAAAKPGFQIPRAFLGRMQILFPLLLLAPFSTRSQYGDTWVQVAAPWAGIVAAALILVGTAFALRAQMRKKGFKPGEPLLSSISVACFGASFVLQGFVPGTVGGDAFHIGELLLPVQQLLSYGRIPFLDVLSIQGLMGVMYGFVLHLFFGGEIGLYTGAYNLVHGLIAAATSLLLVRRLGARWALVLIPVVLTSWDRLALFNLLLLALFDKALWSRPSTWLLLWLPLTEIHFLYNAPAGVALAAATLPAAFYQAGRNTTRLWPTVTAWMAVTAVLSPFLIAWSEFTVANGQINSVAYSKELLGMAGLFPDTFLLTTLSAIGLKSSWNYVPVFPLFLATCVAGALLLYFLKERKTERGLMAASTLIAAVILSPYAFGRVEADGTGRMGLTVAVLFGGTLAVLVAESFIQNQWPRFAVGILSWMLVFHFHFLPMGNYVARSTAAPIILSEFRKVDDNCGVKKHFFAPERRYTEWCSLGTALKTFVQNSETFYDFSNRILAYVHFDKKLPGPIPSMYHAASKHYQDETLSALKVEKVPLVVIGSPVMPDRQSSVLRSYRVFRWLMENPNYFPTRIGSLDVLVDRSRLALRQLSTFDDLTSVEWQTIIGKTDLESLPSAWGRNWENLKGQFEEGPAIPLTANQNVPDTYTVSSKDHFDFLMVRLDQAIDSKGPLEKISAIINTVCRYPREQAPISFSAIGNQFLIPMGADACWLSRTGTTKIYFNSNSTNGTTPWKIREVIGMRLKG